MKNIIKLESTDYSPEKIASLKKSSEICVVFSTFGEREAELIHHKITLLRKEAGDLIDRIILSHRRKNDADDKTERRAKEAWSGVEIVPCNSLSVPDMGLERGKGADMRRTLYAIGTGPDRITNPRDTVIVFLDADVLTRNFNAHFVYGLAGAVLEGCDFAKASFWRGQGRVKKFVAQPLFSSIDHPALRDLRSLAYPLSGEVAGTFDFFRSVSFWQMYGVETGINIDACFGDYRVADVNLGLYDHDHHGDEIIQKMAFGIIRTYLLQLIDYGIIELKDGAEINDRLEASYIDERGGRKVIDHDLREIKYRPLREILPD
ncbi:MAG TPA: hypothetical protein VLM75_06480 [Spirochaetota bacterium]|nr:hypothetical protein [Spirochaetota bacterium]